MPDPNLTEVFGISTKQILSYTERPNVDGAFVAALASDHHIVIYGSSKQGKTSLRTKNLSEGQCHVIRCGTKMTTDSIYASILRDAGVQISTFQTVSDEKRAGATTRVGFKARIPWVGQTNVEGEGAIEKQQQKLLHTEFIGFDFGEAQSVGELLQGCHYNKFIVLENFHYLPYETQRTLAFDLKTFHEISLRFIILGIWREANLLLVHNGDLQDRVTEIPVEPWNDEDFDRVIERGCEQLNVDFSIDIRNEFKRNAYGNIGMLQEFLKTMCSESGVADRQAAYKQLDDLAAKTRTFERKLEDQRGHLARALEGIAGASRTDHLDPLILPYYLVQLILKSSIDELVQGIDRRQLLEKVRALHHRTDKDTIRAGDVSHLLKRLPSLQADTSPPLLYYDNNQQRLKLVDTRQLFVLANIDREQLATEIPSPLHDDEA